MPKIDLTKILGNQIPPYSDENLSQGANQSIRPRISVPNEMPAQVDANDEISNGNRIPFRRVEVPMPQNAPNPSENPAMPAPVEPPPVLPTRERINIAAPVADDSSRNRIAGNPLDWQISEKRKMISDPAYANIPENKPSRITAAAGLALKAIADAMNGGADLGQALGAGIGAGAGGAFAPKVFADMQNTRELGRLEGERNRQYEAQKQNIELITKREEAKGKYLGNQKTIGEISQNEIETINKKIMPLLDAAKAMRKITPRMAEALTQMSGYKWDADQWQQFIDKEVNGKTYTRSENSPVFQENQTVPTNPGGVYRDVAVGNNPAVPIKTDAIPALQVSIDQANANRQQDASQFETRTRLDVEKTNTDNALKVQIENARNLTNFNSQMLSTLMNEAKARGQNSANIAKVQALATRVGNLGSSLEGQETVTTKGKEAYNKIAEEIGKVQLEMQTEVGKMEGGAELLRQMQSLRPQMPQTIKATQISNPMTKKPAKDPLGLF